jgi:trans-aconitate methyltransferase
MPQTWDPKTYAQNAAFVPELGNGVLEWLAPQSGERILDLGCGDGQLTERIAACGANVIGVDASTQMVAAARARGLNIDQASAEHLPYPNHTFEAVFSNAALHWVRGQDDMLSQVHRVLRPGGRFVAEMGGHGNIAAIRVAFAAVLARHGFASLGDRGNYYPTAETYTLRLERHAFTVKRILLFPRPTLLNEEGMAGWLNTFCRGTLDNLPEILRGRIVEEIVALLAPSLRDHDDRWIADYVRLRFIAIAQEHSIRG